MKRVLLIILVAVAALVAGNFGAFNRFPSAALRAATSDPNLVLYSLDPVGAPVGDELPGTFRGYPVLGQIILSKADERAAAVENLRKAARGAWDGAACFEPRHGIRASGSSGTYDIVLCFACGRAVVYHPDGHREDLPIHGSAATLNQFLSAAKVPLAR